MSAESYTLSELIEQHGGLIQTGPFGSQLHQHEYVDSGVPVVMPKDIAGGRVSDEDIAMISENKANALGRHKLKKGDIVFPRRGDIRKCALIGEDQEGYLCGTGCLKITLPDQVYSPHFLYYYLVLPKVGEWLERNAVGTTMLNLNTSILGGVSIPDKSIDEQNEIVSILSAYDDLIENNRRRIQLLEESARLLYKEWFVRLRFPGHEHVKVVDGVPEGWEKTSLTNLAENVSYGLTASSTSDEVGPKFLRITDIVPTVVDWENVPFCEADEKDIARNRLRVGDVVVARTGATVGYAKLITTMNHEAVYASYLVRFKFNDSNVSLIAGIYMESDRYKEHVRNHAGGAAQPNANAKVLGSAIILLPTESICEQFGEKVKALFKQRDLLIQQNGLLAKARDLLLPRLMNGEVAV